SIGIDALATMGLSTLAFSTNHPLRPGFLEPSPRMLGRGRRERLNERDRGGGQSRITTSRRTPPRAPRPRALSGERFPGRRRRYIMRRMFPSSSENAAVPVRGWIGYIRSLGRWL